MSGLHEFESETLPFMRDRFPHRPWLGPSWLLWTWHFLVQPITQFFAQWLKEGTGQSKAHTKASNTEPVTSVSANDLQI